jgi:hypothetical protein
MRRERSGRPCLLLASSEASDAGPASLFMLHRWFPVVLSVTGGGAACCAAQTCAHALARYQCHSMTCIVFWREDMHVAQLPVCQL